MSVFTELDDVRVDLDMILTDVLSSILDEEAIATESELPSGPLAVARLAIHDEPGDCYAIVEFKAGVTLARVIAARMLSVASPQSDDVFDAIAELGNMAGGNVKTLLCLHARMSLPSSAITDPDEFPGPPAPNERGACVRAIVLGQVAQLEVLPGAAIDGLIWPPYTPDEIPERST